MACKGPKIWNDIPTVMKSAKTLHLFSKSWKTYVKIIRAIYRGVELAMDNSWKTGGLRHQALEIKQGATGAHN